MKRFLHYNTVPKTPTFTQQSPVKCYIKEVTDYARGNAPWIMKTKHFAELQHSDRQITKTQNRLFGSALGMVAPMGFVLPFAFYPGLETFFHLSLEAYLSGNIVLFCGSTMFGMYNSFRLLQLEKIAMKQYKEIRDNIAKSK